MKSITKDIKFELKFLLFLVFVFFTSMPSYGQDYDTTKVLSKYDYWDVRVSPFFWYIGVEGQVNVPPQPSHLPEINPIIDIDVSFKEISHSIKFAMMLSGDYRGKWLVGKFSFMSLILDTDAVTPLDILFKDVNVKLYYFSGEASVGYLLMDRRKLDMEAFIGLKFASIKANVSGKLIGFPVVAERHTVWLDPLLGYRIRYFPLKRLELMGYGDVGLNVWKQLSYQYNSEAIFHFSKLFYMSLGYRVWGMETEIDEVTYEGRLKGWISRIGFQF